MPDPQTPTPVLAKTLIPQDLHERGYIKPWLDKEWNNDLAAEVFKKLDGAESLVGKKIGIPSADAKDEEWEQFFGKLRAEKPEDYEVGINSKDEDMVKAMRAAYHGAGVNKRQAAKFEALLKPVFDARLKAATEAAQKRDTEFDDFVKKAFGDEGTKVMEDAQATLKEHAPKEFAQYLDKLDNASLTILAGVIRGIKAKYGAKEDGNHGGAGSGSGGSAEALRSEARKLLASKEYNDVTHPDHERVRAKVEELYKQIG